MTRLLPLALAALLVPHAALAADFEGVLSFKLSGETSGTMRSFVSKHGMRSEAEMQAPPELQQAGMGKVLKTATIIRASEPRTVYVLDVARKTYSTFVSEPGSSRDDATYTVKRAGKDRVAGLSCEKATVSSSEGETIDVCITTELRADSTWMRALAQGDEDGSDAALRKAGLEGIPVRWSSGGTTMELVSLDRRSVPASTFAIPEGFKKTENPLGLGEAETKKMMEDAMKDLTPEQRKQVEEMMKGQGRK